MNFAAALRELLHKMFVYKICYQSGNGKHFTNETRRFLLTNAL